MTWVTTDEDDEDWCEYDQVDSQHFKMVNGMVVVVGWDVHATKERWYILSIQLWIALNLTEVHQGIVKLPIS